MKSNYLNKSGAVVGIQGSSLSKSAFALLNNEAGTHVPTISETKRSKDTRIREYIKKIANFQLNSYISDAQNHTEKGKSC